MVVRKSRNRQSRSIAIVSVLVLTASSFAQEKDWAQALRTEAPQRWAEYEKAFHGKLRHTERAKGLDLRDGSRKVTHETTITTHYGTSGVSSTYDTISSYSYGHASAINDRYAFELRKEPPKGKWVVTEIKMRTAKSEPTLESLKDSPFIEKRHHRVGPFDACSLWLPNMFEENTIDIVKTAATKNGATTLVRFDFVGRPNKDVAKLRRAYPASGWFVLIPEEYWRLHESEIRRLLPPYGDDCVIHTKVRCELNEGLPILQQVVHETKGTVDNAPAHTLYTCEYTIDRKDPDPFVFTLSAFGLPEPINMTPPSRPRYWVWFSLAALILIVGLVVWRWRQKQTAESVSS